MINISPSNISSIANQYSAIIEGHIKSKDRSRSNDGLLEKKLGSTLYSALWDIIRQTYANPCFSYISNSIVKKKLTNIYRRKKVYPTREEFLKKVRNTYFNYDYNMDIILPNSSDKKLSYWLIEKLDVKTCPYCNRQYTSLIDINNSKFRPELDHFHNKSTYRYLASSFYNLIPSCAICNHIKKTKEIGIHPYLENFGDDCRFNISSFKECLIRGNHNRWKLRLKVNTLNNDKKVKIRKNIEVLGLNHFYKHHKDIASEIAVKAIAYSDDSFKNIIETFPKQRLNGHEMKTLVFGFPTEEKELGARPLAKLARDILDQIGVDL
ncbi:5-methylcytosine-specific restriction endonuclease McrA [Elusimicrobium posterum]|uniref:hypothetical protein n=1 Tax=Elusimicrobium posterum TaxID=3116653 RepID=UPI003C725891